MKSKIYNLQQLMKNVGMEVVCLKIKDLEQEYNSKQKTSSKSSSDNETSHAYHSNFQSEKEKFNVINRIQLQKWYCT